MTTISALPPAPSRDDPATFADRADAFVAALSAFVTQANAVGSEASTAAALAAASAITAVNAPGTSATSTTSVAIGTGSKSFTIQTGKALVPGHWVTIARTSSPTSWMVGQVASYNSGTGALVVNATAFAGTGTFTDWTIALSPPITFNEATAAQLWAGTSSLVAVTPVALVAALAPQSIAFSSTLTLNGDQFWNANIGDVTSNFTLANPTNMKPGTGGRIRFRHDSAGGWQCAYGSYWKSKNKRPFAFATAPGAINILQYEVEAANEITYSVLTDVGA